jgi:hypothetical protein
MATAEARAELLARLYRAILSWPDIPDDGGQPEDAAVTGSEGKQQPGDTAGNRSILLDQAEAA